MTPAGVSAAAMDERLGVFVAVRPRLERLAYRMLGSLSEAEDVVQDAWIRWQGADGVDDPTAWLVRATTRLCLDRLKAAHRRRETYVGPWLPEPLIEEMEEDPLARAEEVSLAFLLMLQRLSPLERAVFLLHDVFGEDYAAVAAALGRTEAACRQLAARARRHVAETRARAITPPEQVLALASAFMAASGRQDMAALSALLAEDAVLISDGGGKRSAALRPMVGREDVMALLRGLAWRRGEVGWLKVRPVRVNGLPGVVAEAEDGPTVMALQVGGEGLIEAIYIFRNPDKLGRLATA